MPRQVCVFHAAGILGGWGPGGPRRAVGSMALACQACSQPAQPLGASATAPRGSGA